MLTGHLPFYEKEREALYVKIRSGEFTIPSSLSLGAQSLLTQILITDPTQRISLAEIKRHPWTQSAPGGAQSKVASSKESGAKSSRHASTGRWRVNPFRWPSLKLRRPSQPAQPE